MADNVAITAGAGTTIAADDLGSGVLAQRVKPVHGVDGTGTDVSTASGIPVQYQQPSTAQLTRTKVDFAASGENVLGPAAVGGQTVRLFKAFLVFDSAVDVKFRDGAGGSDLTGAMKMAANGQIKLDFDGEPWFVTSSGNALIMNLSGAVGCRGVVYTKQS